MLITPKFTRIWGIAFLADGVRTLTQNHLTLGIAEHENREETLSYQGQEICKEVTHVYRRIAGPQQATPI
jgi:hypothetical protein